MMGLKIIPTMQAIAVVAVVITYSAWVDAAPTSRLFDIFQDVAGAMHLEIQGKPTKEVARLNDPPRLVVDLTNTKRDIPWKVRSFDSHGVLRVRLGDHQGKTRVVFDLESSEWMHDIKETDRGLTIAFAKAAPPVTLPEVPKYEETSLRDESLIQTPSMPSGDSIVQTPATPSDDNPVQALFPLPNDPTTQVPPPIPDEPIAQPPTPEPPTPQPPPKKVSVQYVQDSAEAEEVHGKQIKPMSLDYQDADIRGVIRMIADHTGRNIITSEDVKGTVNIKLLHVPWYVALDTILRSKGYDRVTRNGIIRVAPAEVLRKEAEVEVAKREAQKQVEATAIKIININYAEAKEILLQLKPLLSSRGTIQPDERTNTLIVEDIESNIGKIVHLAQRLDRQTPQVLIEARIVEANSSFRHEFGIQWGGQSLMTSAEGNPTGLVFPGDVSIAGGADDAATPLRGTSNPGRFAVNLPVGVGTGAGGALGFQFGSAGGSHLLNLRLSAMEESGEGRIISSPRVTTLDNRTARISQGIDIPISVVSALGANTIFVSANLELEVTPHVTNDGSVLMKIKAQKSEPDFANTGARGDPTIARKLAQTEVLVQDSSTTVIGGIYTRNTSKRRSGIPFLAGIPILGYLFRNNRSNDNRAELLVFITPQIVNRDKALVAASTDMP